MKINLIHLNNMRNDEHFQFHYEFSKIVREHGIAKLKIDDQFTAYAALFQDEDTALKKITKSAITPEIQDADKQRDIIFRGMVDAHKAALKHFDPDKQSAAKRLKVVFDTYGNVAKKPLNEQTSAIINMIQEILITYLADSQLIGIADWATQLRERNDVVDGLMHERYVESAGRTDIVMKEARTKVDEAYRIITERINALTIVEGDATYAEFIRTLNAVVEKYSAALAQRYGKKNDN